MTGIAGQLEGMLVSDARSAAIEMLASNGRLEGLEEREQEIPVVKGGESYRDYTTEKWYVKQVGIQDRLEQLTKRYGLFPKGTNNCCWIGWKTYP